MAMKSVIKPVKGTRDYYPEVMALRTWLYGAAKNVSTSFGYQEYEGPLIESIELYAAKSGEELVKEQSFVFEDRGGNLITLRPELTPTLARMVAQRQNQLVYPLRWWSFGPFWRYERPQKGRTREFFQWNVDLIGPDTPTADAELVAIVAAFFKVVGLKPADVQILVNNRQLMEAQLKSIGIEIGQQTDVFRLIDRKAKMKPAEWEAYANDIGLGTTQIDGLKKLLVDDSLWRNSEALEGFFPAIDALGVSEYVAYAPYIIRGLDYYTGTVFEAQAIKGDVSRSILGGGRYDDLLQDVGGDKLPATGFAMGDLVISLVLEELGLIPSDLKSPSASVLVTVFNEEYQRESLRLSEELRQAGLKVNCYPQVEKLSKQLRYGDRIGIKVAVLFGPEELEQGKVTLKNLSSGEQIMVNRTQAKNKIVQMLDEDISSKAG